MKKSIFIAAFLTIFLLASGCGGKKEGGLAVSQSHAFPITISERTQGLSYDDSYSITSWEGTGYNPESIPGVEGQTPPAFRDMSNLYGRTSQAAAPEPQSANPNDNSNSANLDNVERKLVKRANIRIRVENLETADASIVSLMEKYDAYSALTDIEENSRRYSLRVPSHFYDSFLAEMDGLGRLLRRSETTEDVTLRYYDLEGRLATKRELLKTFQSYLGRARNIEEILAVEARISELQNDIEGTGLQLRNLANRIDYATIDLNIISSSVSTQKHEQSLGGRIKEMFANFGSFLSAATVVIIGIIIYGIPILLLAALLFWLLFGRIGLLKKLWQIVMVKKQGV